LATTPVRQCQNYTISLLQIFNPKQITRTAINRRSEQLRHSRLTLAQSEKNTSTLTAPTTESAPRQDLTGTDGVHWDFSVKAHEVEGGHDRTKSAVGNRDSRWHGEITVDTIGKSLTDGKHRRRES